MYKVDIYLTQSTASLSKDERWHGYVVACIKNGEEKTVNGFGHIFGTYHEATLRSLSDALDRLNQSCEVHIHTEDRFVLNMLDTQLEKWAGNNYLNAKGETDQARRVMERGLCAYKRAVNCSRRRKTQL